MNISPAVQERMRELREKEDAAKANSEKMEQLRIEGIKREVEAKSVEWEADLLFEIEKEPEFIAWLRKEIQIPPAVQVIRKKFVGPRPISVKQVYSVTRTVIAGIEVPAAYTLENERMRLCHRVLAGVIASVKETIRAEELATLQRAAEEARVAAEEKAAAAAAKEARKKIALDLAVEEYSKTIVTTNKTPWHSFTGVDPTGRAEYVVYNETSKILRFEARIFAFTDPGVTIIWQDFSPPAFKAPTSWNRLYETGQLPFLTCCPVCTRQITLRCRRVDEWGHYAPDIASVGCVENHYRWDPATNQHWRSDWPGQWNPRDPDGSIAARIKLEKIITEKEIELQQLKVQLAALKKT
jgi:hypothetical protein